MREHESFLLRLELSRAQEELERRTHLAELASLGLSRQVVALAEQLEHVERESRSQARAMNARRVVRALRKVDALKRRLRGRSARPAAATASSSLAPDPATLAEELNQVLGTNSEASAEPALGGSESALRTIQLLVDEGEDIAASAVADAFLHAYPGIVTSEWTTRLLSELRVRQQKSIARALVPAAVRRWPDDAPVAFEAAAFADSDAGVDERRNAWRRVLDLVGAESNWDIARTARRQLEGLGGLGADESGPTLDPASQSDYHTWIRLNEDHSFEAYERWASATGKNLPGVLVSIVMPVFNPDTRFLLEAVESVRAQWYPNWELVICDDASTEDWASDPRLREVLRDTRIKLLSQPKNGGIAQATNSAISAAFGSWIAFMDQDDVIAPDALAAVVELIAEQPQLRMIFTDEDVLDNDGRRTSPHFKPMVIDDLLLGQNVVNHLAAYAAETLADVDGLRAGLDGSQDWDLNLRIVERLNRNEIGHIPRVLYHWRMSAASFSTSRASAAYLSGMRAVSDALQRRGLLGVVQPVVHGGWFRPVLRPRNPEPSVSIVIPTRDRPELIRSCIDSVLNATTYPNYEIIIVDNGTRDPSALKYLEQIARRDRVTRIVLDIAFNFSRLINTGVYKSASDVIVLLNNDVVIQQPDWLTQLVANTSRVDVGAVGPRLLYPDRYVQHAGVTLGPGGVAGHFPSHLSADDAGYFGQPLLQRDVEAVTGAVLAVRREVFIESGGLDEELAVAFNDIDFCLRLRSRGYRNLLIAGVELVHLESASRGSDREGEALKRFENDWLRMVARWGVEGGGLVDSVLNPNLVWATRNDKPVLRRSA